MKHFLILKSAAITAVAAAVLLSPQAASAAALTYTNAVDPFVVGSEPGSVDVTDITITNPNTFTVDITSLTPSFTAHNNGPLTGSAGNADDAVTSANLYNDVAGNSDGNCYVGEDLGHDGTCTVEVVLTVTGALPSKKTGDFSDSYGMNLIKVAVNSAEVGKPGTTPSVNGEFVAQVDLAPEPGGLVLLGSGLLGLAGILRRKQGRG